ELFGYEKGAFTDAKSTKKGLFEIADGGTILLDEIGDMPVALQVKLLRVLQDKRFRRIGGHKDIQVDVRIISATHQNLEKKITEGLFREDLYFRLNVFPINLPPLKDRGNDVIEIADSIVTDLSSEFGKKKKQISPEVQLAFKEYHWPGNIRELRNILERIMILEESEIIELKSLPHFLKSETQDHLYLDSFRKAKDSAIKNFEMSYLKQMLSRYNGNVTQAAEAAQIDRTVFQRYLKKYKIQSADYKK
ncbi:MAG: sigma-54-dependent Fis family transcriptional regulator, partial [Calditrichaeota bacterium]|nr:sigma-54-dependent Fis family transcriptional regulator [Calditrichota bacterium]